MSAGKVNFTAKKGDTFRKVCTYQSQVGSVPVDLLGAIISGKVKQKLSDEGVSLTCDIIDAEAGKFKIELSPTQTAALPTGANLFEVQVVFANGDIKTIMSGNVVVSEQVA